MLDLEKSLSAFALAPPSEAASLMSQGRPFEEALFAEALSLSEHWMKFRDTQLAKCSAIASLRELRSLFRCDVSSSRIGCLCSEAEEEFASLNALSAMDSLKRLSEVESRLQQRPESRVELPLSAVSESAVLAAAEEACPGSVDLFVYSLCRKEGTLWRELRSAAKGEASDLALKARRLCLLAEAAASSFENLRRVQAATLAKNKIKKRSGKASSSDRVVAEAASAPVKGARETHDKFVKLRDECLTLAKGAEAFSQAVFEATTDKQVGAVTASELFVEENAIDKNASSPPNLRAKLIRDATQLLPKVANFADLLLPDDDQPAGNDAPAK